MQVDPFQAELNILRTNLTMSDHILNETHKMSPEARERVVKRIAELETIIEPKGAS